MSDELTKITLELLGKAYARVIDERGVLEGKLVELQSRLDIAVEALKKARLEVIQYYPPHDYTLKIIDDALAAIEKVGKDE